MCVHVRRSPQPPLFLSPRVLHDPRLAALTVKVSAFHGHRDHARPTHSRPVARSLARSARSARAWPSGADPRESVVRALLVVAVIVGRKFSATLASSTLHRGPGRVSYLRQDHLGDTRLGALIQFTVAPIYHFFFSPDEPTRCPLSFFVSFLLLRARSRVCLGKSRSASVPCRFADRSCARLGAASLPSRGCSLVFRGSSGCTNVWQRGTLVDAAELWRMNCPTGIRNKFIVEIVKGCRIFDEKR